MKPDAISNTDPQYLLGKSRVPATSISSVNLGLRCRRAQMVVSLRSISTILVILIVASLGCEQSAESIGDTTAVETDNTAADRLEAAASTTDGDSQPSAADNQQAGKLKVGDKAPDFEVEVQGGDTLRFSNYLSQTQQPTVLLFNRAHW